MEECLRQRESGTGLRCGLRRRIRQTRASVLTDSVLAAPVDAELSPNAVELLDPRIFGRVAGHERGRSDCRFGLAGTESSSAATRPVLATNQERAQSAPPPSPGALVCVRRRLSGWPRRASAFAARGRLRREAAVSLMRSVRRSRPRAAVLGVGAGWSRRWRCGRSAAVQASRDGSGVSEVACGGCSFECW